jgi:nicotinate-nucleotide pyrophosphorylase (carboxylating)
MSTSSIPSAAAAAAAKDTDLAAGQNLAHLLPPSWTAAVPGWFAEDTPSYDWAGFVVGEEEQEAVLWGKSGVS